jgi:16S rRNA (guanine966-N2)-methyltransferase
MRVVAGRYRGRRLRAARGKGTRPTSERARAGLFDWIGPEVSGARVLDLFAGCGSLGIEALSRGAMHAVFVERARPALQALRHNLRELELVTASRIVSRDVERALAELAGGESRFDLVLIDPPYGGDWGQRLSGTPALMGVLAPGGVIITERSRRDEAVLSPSSAWVLRGSKVYGETAFDWYELGVETVE